jgi:hypothetical protein
MATSRQGNAKRAVSQPNDRWRNFDGRLDEAQHRACWRDSRQDAASGVDNVSGRAYAQHS